MIKAIEISDLGLSDNNLIKPVGEYGIYFLGRADDVNKKTVLFKYMQLSHLFSMLDDKTLYIPNRSTFTDLRDKYGMAKYIPKGPFSYRKSSVDSYRMRGWRKQMNKAKDEAMNLCMSCWTLDRQIGGQSEESFLMWKAYTGTYLGCRVETTIQNLIDSIKEIPCNIVISDVVYDNTEKRTMDGLIFYKSLYYQSEHEVRIVALLPYQNHIDIKIDPYTLVQGIKTSPFLEPRFENIMIKIIKDRYKLIKDKIKPSSVMEYPYTKPGE